MGVEMTRCQYAGYWFLVTGCWLLVAGYWSLNAVKLRIFPSSPPFAKGDLGGFLSHYNKSPPTPPLQKGGELRLI